MKQLEEHHLRNTPARIELLRLFSEEVQPLTANEIMLSLGNRRVHVNPVTVYRILDSFLDHGIIHRLEFQGKFHYELVGKDHHHLICTSCGTIEDVSDCNVVAIEKELRQKKGFLIKRHALEFFGLCTDCQA